MDTSVASPAGTGRVLVVGSANVDSYIHLDAFPQPGETVFGTAGISGLGGKGANQAVAARLMGAATTFVGAVGADADGAFVRRTLDQYGVDVSGLREIADAPTGHAHITVDRDGENTIVVISGANAALDARVLEDGVLEDPTADTLIGHDVGLTQGEVPADTIAAFAQLCAARGMRFVLNLAPVSELPGYVLRQADPLIVNETEAAALLGTADPGESASVDDALHAARRLTKDVATSTVITLGASGAVVATSDAAWHEPSPVPERVVDTAGAGDAFVGAVAASLAAGRDLTEAIRLGVAAGSVAVTVQGTVASYRGLRYVSETGVRS
ncbi:ribokinase [Microbacterium sp.]|uniref:ribokinase n=1 Tax=Microbacterium sp. TaxID=51671 RepID=UPI003A8D538C